MRNYISISLFARTQDQKGYRILLRYAAQFLTKMKLFQFTKLDEEWHVILYHDGRLPRSFFREATRLLSDKFIDVYMGCSHELTGTLWRFHVHDRPDTALYFISDADEHIRKTDVDCMNAMSRDKTLQAAIVTPWWIHTDICDAFGISDLPIDGGGFGMRPALLVDFNMGNELASFMKDNDYSGKYGFDEVFLALHVEPRMGRCYRVKRGMGTDAISTSVYKPFWEILSRVEPSAPPPIQGCGDPHIFRGTGDAFDSDTLRWFQENDAMGYPFMLSNKVHCVNHVVDNEVSLRNTDSIMQSRLLELIWHGAWMPEIRRLLPDPQLASVEVHLNGHTKKGHSHRDDGTNPVWNVVIPLVRDSSHCGGTFVFGSDEEKGVSVSCACNNFFIFPGHNLHYREPSTSSETSRSRRTLFIVFTDGYRRPAEALTSARTLHSKKKNPTSGKKRPRPALTMALRSRGAVR